MDNLGRDVQWAFYVGLVVVFLIGGLAGYGLHQLIKKLTN